MRKFRRKVMLLFTLAILTILPVMPAAAAEGNPIGDLLSSVNQLVGSTEVSAECQAIIALNDGTSVKAQAGTNQKADGLTGLLSAVTGGSTAANTSVTYKDYAASSSVNADWGLASSTRAIGSLLASLGGALGGQ
ncbi:MAG: hypothetical protein VB084_09825 [Syntrophomonadaceae bacterium]|nr:hypothetical protein [Syntrophomonadaceae bacterium]